MRKPLVLRGARQTGKSTSVRELGRKAPAFVELNFERAQDRTLVRLCRSHDEMLQAVLTRCNMAAFPPGGVLFLDEVQREPRVIPWLRFFHEDHPEIAVVAAGSLLEVRMADSGFSFPVGRVTFRSMQPLTFLEFARAVSKGVLADAIVGAVEAGEPMSCLAVHDQAMALLHDYLLVGGMPEAVVQWREQRALTPVRQVHHDLRQAFAEDIEKWGTPAGSVERVFLNVAAAYGKRFKYENFVPGMSSRTAGAAIQKLEGAEIVRRVLPTSDVRPPLQERPRSAPKLLPLDIGMAATELGLVPEQVRSGDPVSLLDGRVAECLVGRMLLSPRTCGPVQPYFWVRESSSAAAETDFLVQAGGGLLPVEVKAGKAGSLKSLHQFLWRSRGTLGVRLNAAPPVDEACQVRMGDGLLGFRLLSFPLYCAELLPALRA
jgi:predicted AAA+ superfamily ATPase